MKTAITFLLICYGFAGFGQNTMKLGEGQKSPEANIEDVSWIAGHWEGEAWGGMAEEVWSSPAAGAMMGSFRHVAEGKVSLYEFMTISEVNGTLVLKIKHFNADLTGWEEKENSVEFALVKLEGKKAYFNEFSFQLKNKDNLSLYVVLEGKEQAFHYSRKK